MPENDYDEEQPAEDSQVIRDLRKKAERADQAEAEANALRTENALFKAGLGDLTDIQRRAILATHDGELNSDALKATAESLGFTRQPEAPQEPQVPADEQAAHQRVAEMGAAPAAEAEAKTLIDEINACNSPAELMALQMREGAVFE